MFLRCKVFNTSVDKFVEIKAAAQRNFRQFNNLALIALFECNYDCFYPVKMPAEPNDKPARVQKWAYISKKKSFSAELNPVRRASLSHPQ